MVATTAGEHDSLIARAIDRVLDAERAARQDVADCEAQTRDWLEQARQRRRALMERARLRTVALHMRTAKAVAAREQALLEQEQRAASESAARLADHQRLQAALDELVEHLTGESPDAP